MTSTIALRFLSARTASCTFFGRGERNDRFAAAILRFPFRDGVEPELNERQWPGELRARELDDVRVGFEVVEALADVTLVQLAADGMRHIVKKFRLKNPFVASVRRRLGEAGVVDVVRRAPRRVRPMR